MSTGRGRVARGIDVNSGLRQSCTLTPVLVLFNIYACLVVERWAARVANVEGVGMTECQFADDAALLATTREGAEQAMREYTEVQ